MAVGAGLGSLIPVAMTLVGIVTILRARARRRRGEPAVDQDFERRQLAAAEMERRMANYLAGRDDR
jgi:cytochrome c-type biogenesis protein CcmH/NrfF